MKHKIDPAKVIKTNPILIREGESEPRKPPFIKKKPTPSHWIFALYWWNPIVYIMLLVGLVGSLWEGGIKEWLLEVKGMIKKYDWS